jgi:hypothetical protein
MPKVLPALAVTLVTLVTAVTVAVTVAAPQAAAVPVANAPWSKSPVYSPAADTPPTPSPSTSPVATPVDVQLSAPSANVLWALVDGGTLFRSPDGGASWQQRPWAPHQGGGGKPVVSFVDEITGWALFPGVPGTQCLQAPAEVWRTQDAGAQWSLVSEVAYDKQSKNGLPFEQCKEYMFFANAKVGFVAGHDTTFQPLISRTVDGGSTWTQARLPNPPGFTPGGGVALTVVDIRQFGSVVLAVAVFNASAYVFKSIDIGATWTFLPTDRELPNGQITIVTATHWLNVQAHIQTDDAGKTSQRFITVTDDPVALVGGRFTFPTATVGYAFVDGRLYRSSDSGFHWARAQTPGV